MIQLGCIADDLTGALEVAAKFAARSIEAWVLTEVTDAIPQAPVLVFDTETRHATAMLAYDKVKELGACLRMLGAQSIFKKTDSTLRGNIAPELDALMTVFPDTTLYYAPAYPRMGRTVRNGILHVNGVPVDQTEFSLDPLNPIRESDIERLLRGTVHAGIIKADLSCDFSNRDPALYVIDSETEEDLSRIAELILKKHSRFLVAGTGALAGHLAAKIRIPGAAPAHTHHTKRWIVINGSLHPQSVIQIEWAKSRGWASATPSDAAKTIACCARAILEVPGGAGLERARSTGDVIREILDQSGVDTICVFGGDTAFGIVEALGVPAIRAMGEIIPGIADSQFRMGNREIRFITKAGGFGPADVLGQIEVRLSEER